MCLTMLQHSLLLQHSQLLHTPNYCNTPYYCNTPPVFLSRRAAFSLASKLPSCVIFIDEVDALLGRRNSLKVNQWPPASTVLRRGVLPAGT
jgi:hypothetical protein